MGPSPTRRMQEGGGEGRKRQWWMAGVYYRKILGVSDEFGESERFPPSIFLKKASTIFKLGPENC